jgi:hypothetical protein
MPRTSNLAERQPRIETSASMETSAFRRPSARALLKTNRKSPRENQSNPLPAPPSTKTVEVELPQELARCVCPLDLAPQLEQIVDVVSF